MELIWSAQAEDELFALLDYYNDIDPDIATLIARRVIGAPDPLTRFPHLGPIVAGTDWRKWRAPKTPFILLYEVAPDRVEIVHVKHALSDW